MMRLAGYAGYRGFPASPSYKIDPLFLRVRWKQTRLTPHTPHLHVEHSHA